MKIGRNAPCPCGSGRKYKKCHGAPGPAPVDPENARKEIEKHRAQELVRQREQGLGKPIIALEFEGQRVVAVGNTLHYGPNLRTFPDFLGKYIASVLGTEWGSAEIKKPLSQRHVIVRWYQDLCRYQQKHASKSAGEIQTGPYTGLVHAYYGLAYNLYLLQHNAELQECLVKRLKNTDMFDSAYYETFVSAWFILAGFDIRIEDEQDPSRTHPEFIATRCGRSYAVEAKSRRPNKETLDVGNQLYAALRKQTDLPRFVFVNMNVARDIDPVLLTGEVASAIHGREQKLTIDGQPAPQAYVFVTNQPFHLLLEDENVPSRAACYGFKITDFGCGVRFGSLLGLHAAREKHEDAHAVFEALQRYRIPSTFEGEVAEFAFGEAKRRFIIGESYEVEKGRSATLDTGFVVEDERVAYLGFHDEEKAFVLTARLSEAEIKAYKAHPETFFGQVLKPQGKAEGPVGLFYFFLDIHRQTPKEKILGWMKGARDFAIFETLPVEELRLRYAERLAYEAMRSQPPEST